MPIRPQRRELLVLLTVAAALLSAVGDAAQEPSAHQAFSVRARRYAFDPARIEVHEGDLVKVTLHAEDMPHSFIIDQYRIAKRASAGESVTFEFRASAPGTFPFYCNLRDDDKCREMRGELIVKGR